MVAFHLGKDLIIILFNFIHSVVINVVSYACTLWQGMCFCQRFCWICVHSCDCNHYQTFVSTDYWLEWNKTINKTKNRQKNKIPNKNIIVRQNDWCYLHLCLTSPLWESCVDLVIKPFIILTQDISGWLTLKPNIHETSFGPVLTPCVASCEWSGISKSVYTSFSKQQ